MIANLITTLLLALGVATGTYQSESGNAFNHGNKKPIQKQQETITISFSTVATWNTQNYTEEYKKAYIYPYGNVNTEPTPNYVLPNMIINNSIYTLSWVENNTAYTETYYIYKCINVFNGNTTFQTETEIVKDYRDSTNRYELREMSTYTSTDESIEDLIDITVNASTKDTIKNGIRNAEKTRINYTWSDRNTNEGVVVVNYNTPTITLLENETKYVIIKVELSNKIANGWISSTVILNNQIVNVDYIAPTTTTEIVNVPELIFTIITLPFAFYSTAFNLTIFPNTPYALNFGNLILTILAALILLYLIKKVLK